MKCDYHVHSEFSDDSRTPISQQVLRAVELGLDEICLTDHVDYGIKVDWDDKNKTKALNVNYPKYFNELRIMRQKYSESIKIKSGLEFGVQTHTIKQFNRLYKKYSDELDFVLLSIHQVNDQEFWTQDFQRGKTQEEYNKQYYNELLNVIKNFHDYSVLAHLDLMTRYDLAGVYPFEKVRDIIAEILTLAIKDNKGIELNTSSWRYRLKDTQPRRAILKLYKDLGGEIITLGSDAHSPEYISAHMDDAKNILRDLGYKNFCTFTKMKPEFHVL